MTKNLLTNLENPGQLAEATLENLLTYDEFVDLYEEDLYIDFVETGAYYEFDEEEWLWKEYEEYERRNNQTKT
ncbi:MAG TPA: hypothetical protein EYQ21_01080 [Flavobacteriales bacterium]|nr:hypothetical protein [Flavobacteriales bacterium]